MVELVLRPLDYVTKLVSGVLACELPLDGNPVAIHTTISGPRVLVEPASMLGSVVRRKTLPRGPKYVLQYLGRYTHRVAISNHRLISSADGQVTFRWRDSAHHNEQKVMTLSLDEFLRRFLLHLLPKGFVRIRHFGFLANRRRSTLLPLCRQARDAVPPPQAEAPTSTAKVPSPLWLCPNCGGPMVVVQRLTAAQLQLCSPPLLSGAAA